MGGGWSRCRGEIVLVLRFDFSVIPLAFVGNDESGLTLGYIPY